MPPKNADVLIDGQQLVEREALRHVADAPLDAFGIAADVDAADDRGAATSAAAGRTACGSSSTCRRRCCRGSRRSRPRRTSNDTSSTATNSPKRRVRCWTSMAARPSTVGRHRPDRALEPRLGEPRVGQRARAIELGLQQRQLRVEHVGARRDAGAKRSPTTRRASVARADAVVGRARSRRGSTRARASRWRTSNATWRSNSASRASARARRPRPPRPRSARRAAAVPERPADVDDDVPRVLPLVVRAERCAGSAARSRSRRRRRPAAAPGRAPRRSRARDAVDAVVERAPLRALRDGPRRSAPSSVGVGAAAGVERRDRLDAAPRRRRRCSRAQIRFGDAARRCAPRSRSTRCARLLRLGRQHVVRRDEPGVEAAAHVARRARPMLSSDSRDARCSASRAVTSAQNARVISSRRSARAASRSSPVAVALGARRALERVECGRRCRSATAGRAASR